MFHRCSASGRFKFYFFFSVGRGREEEEGGIRIVDEKEGEEGEKRRGKGLF